MIRKRNRITAFILTLVMILSVSFSMPIVSSAADDFESKIAAFPNSYKPYLRELHKKYPNWTFQPIKTSLDWNEAVKKENEGERSLVTTSAGDAFKSKEKGDYDPATGKYTQYDAGFVRANTLAVGYFMDPRNFLNDSGIFQFEQLSFSSAMTVEVVEQVLKGSFMSNKKITYYDTKGNQKTIDIKYSQVIYNAGKKYNVNPCHLASKIINEVGLNGSGSVSGKYPGYEGYYNFFNIGATSGEAPIKNGLSYAKGGKNGSTSFSRPWTDPQKAIMGGAEFIASGYISKGQDTGYFQRFNVGPDAVSATYTHQYMTDISGAYFQSNTTYNTYNALSLMSLKRVFKIPIYNNMPGASAQATSFSLKDAAGQTGVINVSSLNVRSQPNTSSSKIVAVPGGTKVNILGKYINSAGKYNFLSYPYWYRISFSYNGASYTGYACSDYIDITSAKSVVIGSTFNLPVNVNASEKPTFYSDDNSVVRVNANGSLTALKAGKTSVSAFTSKGIYDVIKISVTDGLRQVTDLHVASKTDKSVSVSWSPVLGAAGYEVYTTDSAGQYKLYKTVTASKFNITGLKAGASFSCKVRAYGTVNGTKRYGEFSSAVKCGTYQKMLSNLRQGSTASDSVELKWNAADGAYAYEIFRYNDATSRFVRIAETKSTEYTDKGLKSAGTYKYSIVAKKKINGASVEYAGNVITVKTAPAVPEKLKVKETTSSTVSISWAATAGASKYAVYKLQPNGKYAKIATVKTNSYTDSGLSANEQAKYRVKAGLVSNGNTYYGKKSSSVSASTGPSKVKNLSYKNITESSFTLTWSKVRGASGYYIYKYDNASGKFVFSASTAKTSYTFKKLSAGITGIYRVRAYSKVDGVKYKGTASSKLTVRTLPAKVTGLKFSDPTRSSYTLSWNSVNGAAGYDIYKLQKDGKYKKIASTSSASYKAEGIKSAKSDSYKIRAYVKNGDTKLYGEFSDKLKATTVPKNVTSLSSAKSKDGFILSWDKVSGADGYLIYSYNSGKKKYEYVGRTSSTEFTVTPKTSTKYLVSSYVKCNNVRYKSSGKTISVNF